MVCTSYVVSYELCSLFFLAVVMVRFFTMRRFPSRQNSLYAAVLFCALADIILDVVGSYTIEYAALLPVWVNYVVNTAFYSLQIGFPVLMMSYVLVLGGRKYRDSHWLLALMAPAVLCELLLVLNIFNGCIFSVPEIDGAHRFIHGPWFKFLYPGSAFYLVACLALTVILRADLQVKERQTINCVILIVTLAIVLQMFFPAYLLTGVAIAVGILMMFFTLQNPEDQLDLVTGVFNYSTMMEFLGTYISEKRPLRLIAVDVGGIRRVNSAMGLTTGNLALSRVGSFLSGLSDIWVFRMIGTRFLLITGDEESFLRTIIRVGERFDQPWDLGNSEVMLYATVRYFDEPDFFTTPEEVVDLLDVAFAAIKSEGWGNRARIGAELLDSSKRSMLVEGAVREALNTGEGLELWFQPIFDVQEGRFSTAEVLLRLTSPKYGRISPGEFIPAAEKSGLILQIDRFVVKETARFLERGGFVPGGRLKYLEVNLSAAEFYHNTRDSIGKTLADLDVPAELICFEVTETAAVSHPIILQDFMSEMTARGFRFALDDFGTGYANVASVAKLPFHIVKMDRGLLISEDEKSRELFDGLIGIFNSIGLEIVVEGVESAEQSRRVTQLRADYIQGYYYAKPMPEKEFLEFLRTRE